MVETGRGFAGEAFDDDVGAQAAENLDEEVDVLLDAPEPEPLGRGVIFGGKRRAAEKLQLVELYGSPGRPRMKCAPVCIPRSAVIRMARRAVAKSWPRFMRRSVASEVDSTPYSMATYRSRAKEAK